MSEIIAAIIALLLTSITGYLYIRFLKSSKTTVKENKPADIQFSEKKYNAPDKDFPFPTFNLSTKVYLWGPTGTGKTWLIDSFIRKMNLVEQALLSLEQSKQTDFQYKLWVEDILYNKVIKKSLDSAPTEDIDYRQYTLHRAIRPFGIQETCEIGMLDGRGDETTGQVIEDANTQENRARVLAAHEALKDADYLLITVDRGVRILDEEDEQNAGKHYVQRLHELLTLRRKPNQRALICFTKCDRYGGEFGSMDSALARLFGDSGKEIGELVAELNPRVITFPFYFTSAVGYYFDAHSGKVYPNINSGEGKIVHIEKWNPSNVHKPFFEMLDNEQQKIIREKSKSVFIGKLPIMGNALIADRLEFYKKYSYSTMMDMVEKSISQS